MIYAKRIIFYHILKPFVLKYLNCDICSLEIEILKTFLVYTLLIRI